MSMMFFEILFFLGVFSMFVFILVGQDKVLKHVRKELAESKSRLLRIEAYLGELSGDNKDFSRSERHEVRTADKTAAAPSKLLQRIVQQEPKMSERKDVFGDTAMRETRAPAATSVPLSSKPLTAATTTTPLEVPSRQVGAASTAGTAGTAGLTNAGMPQTNAGVTAHGGYSGTFEGRPVGQAGVQGVKDAPTAHNYVPNTASPHAAAQPMTPEAAQYGGAVPGNGQHVSPAGATSNTFMPQGGASAASAVSASTAGATHFTGRGASNGTSTGAPHGTYNGEALQSLSMNRSLSEQQSKSSEGGDFDLFMPPPRRK